MDNPFRRALCRVAFVLLCLAPTVAVAWWGYCATVVRQQRQLHAHWEQRILDETGLRAQAERIQVGRRGDVVLENLVLQDPETQAEVARIRQVHAAPAGKRGWVIDVSYPELSAEQLARLWEPLYDRLRIARGGESWSGLVSARNVTIRQGQQSSSLSQWECQFGTSATGGFAQMEFLLDGYQMTERARVVVTRHRETDPPQTVVAVRTGSQPLPCSLAASVVEPLSRLGSKAHFAGTAQWRLTPDGWRGEHVSGRLTGVQLDEVITAAFPTHVLTGSCDIDIRRAEFENGTLVAADATAHSDGGIISRSLLLAARDALHWKLAAGVETIDRHRYRQLNLDVRIGPDGLLLRGDASGVILAGDSGPLAWQHDDPVPVVQIVRTLVPDNVYQVPATRQTALLTRILPVPDLLRSERTAGRPPESPGLRLRD